jgi:hypothetical protein
MLRVSFKDTSVRVLGTLVLFLKGEVSASSNLHTLEITDIFLLFVHVTDLEPNILLIQRSWRVVHNVSEALHTISSAISHRQSELDLAYLQALLELLLLLVDYTESEVDFICLLEVRLHSHDLGKCFLGMVERSITVVQDSYSVPKLGLLRLVRACVPLKWRA